MSATIIECASAVPPTQAPETWHAEHDVIVIGSGFAGLAAAITAREAGADAIILEKMPEIGGNSVINGGLMAAVCSDVQQKEGIEDSVELYLSDLLKAGLGLNHVELITKVATLGQDLPEWCSQRGVEWNLKLEHLGGHSVPRTYLTTNSRGSGIVNPLVKYYQEQLVGQIQTHAKLVGLVKADNGRVIGVKVLEDYEFDFNATDGDRSNASGHANFYKAQQAVIIATGGFSQDPFLRGIQDPSLAKPTDELESTNHPGATGESIELLLKAGAAPVHLSWIQSGPWASPHEKGFGVGSSYQMAAGFRYGIMVDKKTGCRFINELADRRTRALAIFDVIGDPQNPNYPFTVTDSCEGVMSAATLKQCLERKVVLAFDTLEEIATHFNMPQVPFLSQIEAYNQAVKSGTDQQFGKPMSGLTPIEKPPFYVMEGVPKAHHTMGGILIDGEGRVIDMGTQQPIPGLYAAGEVVGGPHGADRLGSCAIPDCLVFGRICGTNASKEKA